uniref:Transmembrane protein n=1 Tax=Leishmania guyanensis TaxID=5670 RepID=A0A1E1IU55_LEIGU|nr:Hypothetical protein BN36_2023120 [Leishmania guyanensis]
MAAFFTDDLWYLRMSHEGKPQRLNRRHACSCSSVPFFVYTATFLEICTVSFSFGIACSFSLTLALISFLLPPLSPFSSSPLPLPPFRGLPASRYVCLCACVRVSVVFFVLFLPFPRHTPSFFC